MSPRDEISEGELRDRLSRLGRIERTAFAAACAERLWALFVRYAEVTGQGDVHSLAEVLDETWRAIVRDEVDLEQAQNVAEQMVPSDDGAWVYETGYGQNAAACAAYAVRTWLSNDPQEAVWAARQAYEAADYVAQRLHADLDLSGTDSEGALLESQIVQTALTGMLDDLSAAESMADSWERVRLRAREGGGEAWAHSLP